MSIKDSQAVFKVYADEKNNQIAATELRTIFEDMGYKIEGPNIDDYLKRVCKAADEENVNFLTICRMGL